MRGLLKLIIVVMILSSAALVLTASLPRQARAAGVWYVAPSGNDANSCASPSAPCATINGALNKPGFVEGDMVRVAIGTYIGIGNEVILLNKSAILSGGWDITFSEQSNMSTIDGQTARRGITIEGNSVATITHFIIQHGSSDGGGGLRNNGATVTVYHSQISNNWADLGGGVYNDAGTLNLSNSSVNNNAAGQGGGVHNNIGTARLTNVTVSGNSAWIGGGVFNFNWGTIYLNNNTVAYNRAPGNVGDGIHNNSGYITLRNTIVAQNISEFAVECDGLPISSAGYNLIENTQRCPIGLTTGDLQNVTPGFFVLSGMPGYHPLYAHSPAIDKGNPIGCTDDLGNPLTIDQRGTPRPLNGDDTGDARCDIGAFEFDPMAPIVRQSFLPIALRHHCTPFFDDFSNPASGWPTGEDAYVRAEYLNGEYRILSKDGRFIYLFRSPSCSRENYTVEADMRWEGATGDSYGLLFGITDGFSQYYLFYVSADYQEYALFRRSPSGFTPLQLFTPSPAIKTGGQTNHLKVTRNGSAITLEVNGSVLGTWYDGTVTGSTFAGIYSSPYINRPISDARFDNFSMATLLEANLSTRQSSITATGEALFIPVERTGLPETVDRLPSRDDWRRESD